MSRTRTSYALLDKEPEYGPKQGWIDFRNFKYHWIDTLMSVVLWLIGALVQQYGQPFHRYFSERDPTLSYPYVTTVQVPTWLLFCLAWFVPAIVMFCAQLLLLKRFGDVSRNHKVAKFFLAQLVLFQALGLTLFLTSLSKVFFGRQRPNFYAFCDYKGYRNAVATGDFTEYFSLTQEGVQGHISFCRASEGDVKESMFSHPSGHASLSFCGLGFLSLFLHHMLLSHRPTKRNHLWKAIVFAVPMFVAIMVAATRTRDYWHNYDDTIMGALLGFGCSCLAFQINYSRGTSHNVEYIGDLFPGQQNDDSEQSELNMRQSENSNYVPPAPTSPSNFV